MRPSRRAVLLLSVLLASEALAAQGSQALEQDAQKFADTVGAALQAKDRALLESSIADGFEFVHSTGRVEDRASFIDRAAAGQLASQRTPGDRLERRVRVFNGDTALETILTAVKLPQSPADAPPTRVYTRHVYIRSAGRWSWISAQSTVVTVPPAR
jgi:hypothetical protein